MNNPGRSTAFRDIVRASHVSMGATLYAEIYSTINLAEDHLCLDEIGTAETILIEAAERLRTGAFDSHLWRWQMRVGLMFARLLLAKGNLVGADSHLVGALAIAEPTESRRHLAEGYRIRGEIWLAAGRDDEARAELRRALDVAESTASPRTIWETAAAFGRVLGPAREVEARDAYRRGIEVLHAALPRIPRPELRESLLRSEPVARLIEEAGRLGLAGPSS